MAWMPAHRSGEHAVFGMKMLCIIPENPQRGLDGHQGAVVLMDGVTGELRALMDASAVTAIRTAASRRSLMPRGAPLPHHAPAPRGRRPHTAARDGRFAQPMAHLSYGWDVRHRAVQGKPPK